MPISAGCLSGFIDDFSAYVAFGTSAFVTFGPSATACQENNKNHYQLIRSANPHRSPNLADN
jgi:hypothetical protein